MGKTTLAINIFLIPTLDSYFQDLQACWTNEIDNSVRYHFDVAFLPSDFRYLYIEFYHFDVNPASVWVATILQPYRVVLEL